MARTHRAHLSPTELAKRGGTSDEKRDHKLLKTHKQRRPNDRAKLRKEFL